MSAGDSFRADERPLIPGVIHGVRAWTVDEHWLLRGAGNGSSMVWSPDGEPTSAHCLGDSHRAPDPACGCGLYAYHPHSFGPTHAGQIPGACVSGVVEAWGRIELHADGFRAQYARPILLFERAFHLVSLDQLADLAAVSQRYRTKVVGIPRPEHAGEWCGRQGLGLERATVVELLAAASRGPEGATGEVWRRG